MKNDDVYINELKSKLLEVETKFDILYNNSPDMYVAVSPLDANVKFCNKTLLTKTGYTEDEIINKPIFNLYSEKCMPKVEKAFHEFVETGKVVNKQLILKRKDGTLIDVILNVIAVKDEDGKIIYSTSSWRDITEELKSKEREIENEYLLLESQRIANIASWKYNLETKKILCSEEMYKIFDINKNIEITEYSQLTDKIPSEEKEKVINAFNLFLINKEKYDLEYSIVVDNKIKYLSANTEPIYDSSKKLIMLIGTIQDITFTKSIQNELEDFNKNLETKIAEKTKHLELAQEQLILSEKMASLGSLMAGISHEINTPIGIGFTGISHFRDEINLLADKYKNDEMEEDVFEDFLNSSKEISYLIYSNLDRAANLIKSFKQVAVDQTSENKRKILFFDYIEENLLSLNSIIKRKDIDIKVECDRTLEVYTYPGKISQVITNLIINSFNHGFKNREKGSISIDICKLNDEIVIEYRDNGCGVGKDNLSKIFTPFFTTNREFGGTGLGLSIIYNIVTKSLNGSISCSSKINEGIEFIIKFKL